MSVIQGMSRATPDAGASARPEESGQPAQILSYNIGRGKDGPEGAEQHELDQVAAAIAEHGPDVVGLQEVHEDDIPVLLQILEEEHGLTYYADFAATLPDGNGAADSPGDEGHDPSRTSPYGVAVLSRNPILTSRHDELPNPGEHEPRVLQQVTTTIDGEQVTVFNTHLATEGEARGVDSTQEEQTEFLLQAASETEGPTIVTGDFNQTPGTLADRAKAVGVDGRVDVANDKSEPTVGLGDLNPFNNRTIDYVLVSDDIQVEDREVQGDGVSDHRPVLVEVTL